MRVILGSTVSKIKIKHIHSPGWHSCPPWVYFIHNLIIMEENKLTEEEVKIFEGCKTLPPEFAEATDFKAEEAIDLDYSIKLPENYSLGRWIYKTSNQGGL